MNEKNILAFRANLKNIRESFINSKSLIQIIVNFPGPDKNIFPSSELFLVGLIEITKYLNVNDIIMESYVFINSPLGRVALINTQINPYEIKEKIMIFEKEFKLSMYIDFDIFDENNKKISRKSLNYESRKCFICNDIAKKCSAFKNHTSQELINKMIVDYKKYKKEG